MKSQTKSALASVALSSWWLDFVRFTLQHSSKPWCENGHVHAGTRNLFFLFLSFSRCRLFCQTPAVQTAEENKCYRSCVWCWLAERGCRKTETRTHSDKLLARHFCWSLQEAETRGHSTSRKVLFASNVMQLMWTRKLKIERPFFAV